MKFYDQHNEVFFKKDISSLTTKEGHDVYNPMMVSRYASLKDPYWAVLINYSTNRYFGVLTDKIMHAKMISGCTPKDSKAFIAYPFKKKEKIDKDIKDTKEKFKMLSNVLQLSIRETESILERTKTDIHDLIPS